MSPQQRMPRGGCYVFTISCCLSRCLSRCPVPTWTRGKSIRHMQQRRDDMIGRSFKLASLSHVMLCYVKACTSAGCTMSNASVAMTTESRPAAVSRPRVVSVSSSQLVVMTTESRPDGVVMTTESRPAAVPRPRVVSVSSSQLVVSCLKPDKPNGLSSLHRLVPLL